MNLAGFALAVLLIELTPGPNMAWLAGLAATQGRQHGLHAVAGIALGLIANGLLAALGLAALLQLAPQLWTALRLSGAAMMVWLAVETWRDAQRATPPSGALASPRGAFATGALLNLLNPKAYLFFVVVAPQFVPEGRLGLGSAVVLALVSTLIATAIHLAIVLASSRAHAWLAVPSRTRTARRAFALVMLAVATTFLFAELR